MSAVVHPPFIFRVEHDRAAIVVGVHQPVELRSLGSGNAECIHQLHERHFPFERRAFHRDCGHVSRDIDLGLHMLHLCQRIAQAVHGERVHDGTCWCLLRGLLRLPGAERRLQFDQLLQGGKFYAVDFDRRVSRIGKRNRLRLAITGIFAGGDQFNRRTVAG